MIQPVELHDFMLTFFVSALIILSGACYALFYAYAKLAGKARFLHWAYLAYAVLAASVLVLTQTTHLEGWWLTLAVAMLVGYFAAPRAIFHLCAATHAAELPHS